MVGQNIWQAWNRGCSCSATIGHCNQRLGEARSDVPQTSLLAKSFQLDGYSKSPKMWPIAMSSVVETRLLADKKLGIVNGSSIYSKRLRLVCIRSALGDRNCH